MRRAANLLAGRAFVFKMFPLTHLELGEAFNLDDVLSFGSLPKMFSLKDGREKILERNGLPIYAIEIKSTSHVHEGHIKGVETISKKLKKCIPVVLSNDVIAKKIDGVSCMHWKQGLIELGIYNPL